MNKFLIITLFCSVSVGTLVAQNQDSVLFGLMPHISEEMKDPAQRANYLALHYWDKFNFKNTALMKKDNLVEHAFVDFIDLLSITPKDTLEKAVNILMKKAVSADPDALILFAVLSEKYLYESDSPYCDEEKFIPFMRFLISSPKLTDTDKIRPKFMLNSILKNRRGELANDFTYTLVNGDTATLYSINTDYTLLFFKNPTCEDCNDLANRLIFSSVVNDRIQQGKLKILTVYLFEDTEEWKSHASSVLNSWIYARDAEEKINAQGIYNIKKFPTIYLMDKDKRVILKDTNFKQLEKYLKENGGQ